MGKAADNKLHKKNALLHHAFLLFMNKGVSNTSISDITEHAGVAKGTFYSYFTDKEDLIQKLLAQKGEQLFDNAVQKLKEQPDMPVDDTIVFIVNDIINQLISDAKLHRFMNKNLMFGLYKKAFLSEEIRNDVPYIDTFLEIIQKDGDEWNDPLLMLYTIFEFVGSTCYTIILDDAPTDYEHFKPYLFSCLKGIVSVYKVQK